MDDSSLYLGTSSSEWSALGYNFSDQSLYKSLFTVNVTELVSPSPSLTISNLGTALCNIYLIYCWLRLKRKNHVPSFGVR